MSLINVSFYLARTRCLKFFVSCYSEDIKSKPCKRDKSCSKIDIDSDVVVKDKNVCESSPPCTVTCPVAPCLPDLPPTDIDVDDAVTIPSKKDAKIIVVGAGAAGLSCAQRLVNAGFKSTIILEAECRPGGRIQSGWFSDIVIEKGSDWCCNTCSPFNNPIVQLGLRNGDMNVPLCGSDPSQGLLYQTDCSPLPLPIGCMAFTHLLKVLREAYYLKSSTPATESSLADSYAGIRLHSLLKKVPPEMSMVCARILLGLKSYFTPSQRKVISDSFGSYMTSSDIRIPLGYMGSLAPMISDISSSRIHYQKQVLTIRWGTVQADQHPRAILKCRDGSEYSADYVVVTIPLGALRNGLKSLFCPPLSTAKSQVIFQLEIVHKGKIFFEYDQPFYIWRDIKFDKKWKEGELSSRKGFTNSLISLEELKGSEHVLVATFVGPMVEEMEKMGDMEVVHEMMNFLRERSPEPLPLPKNMIRTSWTTNPNFLGSYCRVSPKDVSCLKALKVPLPDESGCSELPPILYFAGEHTCSPEMMGTVKGAMISGIREAENVIAAINRAKFKPHLCEHLAVC